jgi:hypothetical protein
MHACRVRSLYGELGHMVVCAAYTADLGMGVYVRLSCAQPIRRTWAYGSVRGLYGGLGRVSVGIRLSR